MSLFFIAGIEKVEMHDASTSTCVEMLDAAVGVDKIAESPCHVAVQTCTVISYSIASQTSITNNSTCAIQTDDIAAATDSISHPDDKFYNCILPKDKTTCSVGKKQQVEIKLSKKVYAETKMETQNNILMHDASTSTCVELLDAAVGVDKIAESPCHVAIQTQLNLITSSIACQTSITTNNTCAIQTDNTVTADSICYPEDKFDNCSLPKEKMSCNRGKKQQVETRLSRKVHAETKIETQSVAENGSLMHDSLKSSLKGTKKVNFLNITSKHDSAERKWNTQSSMVRFNYNKPDKCSKSKANMWESLTPQLCSRKSDDSSDEDSPFGSKDSFTPAATTQSFRLTDRPVTQQSTAASSGLFVVEAAPHLSPYSEQVHPDKCPMPVVPQFCHHYWDVDPVQFRPNMRSCEMAMQSISELSKGCCYRHPIVGACANMNHPCVPQAAHTHHGLSNYFCFCSSCVNAGQSNHRPPESEVKVQMSSTRPTSDNSAKRVWNRIIDSEDSSSNSETEGDHKMPFRKLCLNNHTANSRFSTQMGNEDGNTSSRRRGICTDKQDSSVGAGSGRKVATKRMKKKREAAHINGRDSTLSTDEEVENKTSRLGNKNTWLKGNHLQARSSSSNMQEGSISSMLRRRKNEHNADHKKGVRKCASKKFPLSKQKHKSKLKLNHMRHRQLTEHTEESDIPVMIIRNKVHSNQSEAVECMQDCQVGSCKAQVSTVLLSNIQQKTEAVTEENIHKHSSCMEMFSTVSDVYPHEDQQSHRTAADIQTPQPEKVSGSFLNKCKRKAPNGSASSETQKSKRAKTGSVSMDSGESVTGKDSEATSSILLHYVPESSPEKYITRTRETNTDISLPSTEQPSLDQEFTCSATNKNCLLVNQTVNAHETGQAVGKTNPAQVAGPVRKISKLEKFRRSLIKSRMPSKIATKLSEKCLKSRTRTSVSETSDAVSKSITPEVTSVSGVKQQANMPDSCTTISNMSLSPRHHSTLIENEKPSTNLDITVPNVANGFANHSKSSSVVDLHLTCNSVTEQIFDITHTVREMGVREDVNTETNHAVHVSRNLASSNTSFGAEIPSCVQDQVLVSSHITQASNLLSKVDHASENHSDSSLRDEIFEAVKVPSVIYKESVPEVNHTAEATGLATSPQTYHEVDNMSKNVMKVCSSNTTPETCQGAADFRGVQSPATVSKMDEVDEIFPRLHQELIPCPVSPIKDPVIDKLQLKSETVESSVITSDAKQIAELPVNGLIIKSPERLTRSSMHQKTGEQITTGKCVVVRSTDELFPGCVLRWALKYYEDEYKKKHPKKSKSMMGKLKNEG
jgi:hypothetical protein